MSQSSLYPRLERLLKLADTLRDEVGLTARELGERIGVSSRTVLRDLAALAETGVAIVRDDDGQYRLADAPDGPWGLTEDEAIGLLMLARTLGGGNTGLVGFEHLRSVADKLAAAMPAAQRERAAKIIDLVEMRLWERATPDRAAAFYQLLLNAAVDRKRVRIRYRSLSEESFIETDLAPYRLLFAKRTWYCIGHSSVHRQVRTFHLGRIGTLEPLPKKFRIPKGFSLDEYFGTAWRLIREPVDEHVVVDFGPLVANNVAEIAWHPSQSITWRNDGSIRFEVDVAGLHEISWWILGYGAQAEVVEPDALRELIRRQAETMVERYGESS